MTIPLSPKAIFLPPELIQCSSDLLEPCVYQLAWVLYFIFAVGEREWRGLKDMRPIRFIAFASRMACGYRPQCPDSAPGIVRDVMLMCWKEAPAGRPSFVQIVENLEDFVEIVPLFSTL